MLIVGAKNVRLKTEKRRTAKLTAQSSIDFNFEIASSACCMFSALAVIVPPSVSSSTRQLVKSPITFNKLSGNRRPMSGTSLARLDLQLRVKISCGMSAFSTASSSLSTCDNCSSFSPGDATAKSTVASVCVSASLLSFTLYQFRESAPPSAISLRQDSKPRITRAPFLAPRR